MKPNEINNAIWKWGQAKHKVQLIGSTPFNNFCLILEKDKTGYQRMYQLASVHRLIGPHAHNIDMDL